MRILLLMLLLVPCTWAQTALISPLDVPIPPLTAPTPAVVDPGQRFLCPRNGGYVTLPPRTLLKAGQTTTAPAHTSTAATTAPVTMGATYTFTAKCPTTLKPDANGNITMDGCEIVLTKVTP